MARVSIEDCLQKVNNRFMLVHLGAKRVIQLRKGVKPLVDAPKNKEIVLALREIAAGEVNFGSIVEIDQEQLSPKPQRESPVVSETDSSSPEDKKTEAADSGVEASASQETRPEDAAPEQAD
ncbi:MAG: DNA-directed RNA polymerase subunit omega [Deltaproteobacteria bacterium]|nr:MAG: DNA-directed RNA polymerase subunit omega [Deltaproteobacteria bacterium]